MSAPPLDPTHDLELSRRFDNVIEWLIIALLAFMPLAFGAVEAWSEQLVIIAAAAVTMAFLLKAVVYERTALVWSWAYIPIALFVGVVLLQLVPLPAGLVRAVVSPNTAEIKQRLLEGLPDAVERLETMTLSFYPHATRHDLRLVLAVAAVFCVALNIYRRTEQIQRLLGAIAVIGGVVALLGLVQRLSGTDRIYWMVPTVKGKFWFGTFILHSHYGQFMNLSVAAALALTLVKLQERFGGDRITAADVSEFFSSSESRVVWVFIAIVVLGSGTIFLSMSRGAMISLLIAGSFTTLVLTYRRSLKGSGWAMALIALCAFMFVLYVGFDAVYDRLGTLGDLQKVSGGRTQILKDLSVSFKRFPLLGTGLGTHEVVYPMFDRSTSPALAAHAENEYAQAAEETGLIGLGLLAALGVIVWLGYVRSVRSEAIPIRTAAYGLGMGLLAISIHSLSDFGQHLPANAMLSAVFCALLLSLKNMRRRYHSSAHVLRASRVPKGLRIAVLVTVAAAWTPVLLGANHARAAEAYWKQAESGEEVLRSRNWNGSNAEYVFLLDNAARAAARRPDNIKYHHWLNVYRWESIRRFTDPNTGEFVLNEKTAEFTQRIVDEFKQAVFLCPTFGPTWCVMGQLEKFVLGLDEGAARIRTGHELAPCDPTACFVAGLLDAIEGDVDASYEKFQRALELSPRLFPDVADVYINTLRRPDLAVAIAGQDTWWLTQAADMLTESDEHQELVVQARARVRDLLKARCEEPGTPATTFAALGHIYYREKNLGEAVECLRRAVALDYGRVSWRLTLARALAETGHIEDAIHEARICLRLNPQMKAAERLIADLSVRAAPDAGSP
ncbi:MAG TPA: hypothetical protein ENN81_04115 [Phycisphaerales bacterium]|nr:hypothetical protein [Phycisphaerales bacterium]